MDTRSDEPSGFLDRPKPQALSAPRSERPAYVRRGGLPRGKVNRLTPLAKRVTTMVGAYPPAPRLDRPVAPHARAPPIEKYGFPQKLYGYITLDRLRAHDYFQPMTPGLFTPIVVARFWNKVNKGSPTECWPWTGQKNKKKKHGKVKIYGRFDVADRSFAAHRIAVWLSGSIIDGLQVNHACGNSLCCNPNPGHAYAGTHQENMADGRRLGEFAKGIDHGQAKLTPDLVEFIRATSARVLARTLGVSKSLIDAVRHDHIWKPEE